MISIIRGRAKIVDLRLHESETLYRTFLNRRHAHNPNSESSSTYLFNLSIAFEGLAFPFPSAEPFGFAQGREHIERPFGLPSAMSPRREPSGEGY